MRIGIDAVPLQKLQGGISYYIFYLLDELIRLRSEDSFFLFVETTTTDVEFFTKYTNVKICPVSFCFLGHSIWSQTFLSYACWRKKIDIFWGTTQSVPLLKKTNMKTFVTLYDFVYLICPETTSIYRNIYFRCLVKKMLLKTNAILPISRGTGQKLEQFYQLKFTAIVNPPLKPQIFFREGIDSFLKAHFLKFKQYIVVVGTLEPRKNFQQLISVYLQSIEIYGLDRILPLVMIGGGGWKNEKLREMLTGTQQRYPSHFFVQGYITDDELAFFLSGARYYLMLSKYEGYGMPLAEARTCRTAVICLDQIEMKEAAEDDGIFLNSDEWEKEIVPYLLIDSEVQYPRKVLYESNQEKALRISEIIDQL